MLATFSIVAFDPKNGDLGVAVQSKFLAAGAVVPWAKAGVGAIATQSWANTSYGPKGLELLSLGLSAPEVVEILIAEDEGRDLRQVGIVDAQGRAAAYTGKGCFEWAGHIIGPGYACQGNILAGPKVVEAMAEAFERSDGELAHRLVAALEAGQAAGGDRRGQQSAALLVVREKGGYGGFNDRYVDLRVDDHPEPIKELKRLLSLYELYFFKPKPEDLVEIKGEIALEIQRILLKTGDYKGPLSGQYDEATKEAFKNLCLRENLEERWQEEPLVDLTVLNFLRERFGP
jgi:uncharacterized Ntn-hydrolase superfamily protein